MQNLDIDQHLKGAQIILTGTVGSHSYGTATSSSDYDLMSVVIPPLNTYLGLDSWGSAGSLELTYDDPTYGYVEHKFYELRKFVTMCEGFNPNAIPLLWLDPSHYTEVSEVGHLLLAERTIFNSRRAYHTFSGYAHSQLRKMGGIFDDGEDEQQRLRAGYTAFVRDAEDWLEEAAEPNSGYDRDWCRAVRALLTHAKEEIKRMKTGPVTGRMGAKRKELRDKYGYDVKFAFHTIRLLTMAVEFLTTPEHGLIVNRTGRDADYLFSIRNGMYSQETIKGTADTLFQRAVDALPSSVLPNEPDRDAISALCLRLLHRHFFPS